ncbi:MAG: hypothetical protein ABFS46_17220 [Myxococcota bacterium]
MVERQRATVLGAALALVVASGCTTPVGVDRVDTRTVHRTLTANVLSVGEPSPFSLQVLERLNLRRRHARDPEEGLAALHAAWVEYRVADILPALAELSFLQAKQSGDRSGFLASAIYAYAFLFPEDPTERPEPFDPRLRLCANLYNRGLTEGLLSRDGEEVILRAGRRPLAFGAIEIEVDPEGFVWGARQLERFIPVADFRVRGLRNRYRRPGIGAPLAAAAERSEQVGEGVATARLPERVMAPVTLLLRIDHPSAQLATGELQGHLELFSEYATAAVSIGGQEVPLEVETTAALAYGLHRSRIWNTEIAGFRGGDLLPDLLRGADDGLFMLQPYHRGRIPVVLVHGTASSPARWAELLNELQSYPEIRRRYQLWFFMYPTGPPILLSAAGLRDALASAVEELDPEGTDPGLRRMVVIGHSQGGLLTRLVASDSGTRFWDGVSDVPFEEVSPRLQPETRELLEDALFFESLPFVERVIFISTPHGGSYMARGRLGSFAAGLVQAPGRLVRTSVDLLRANPDERMRRNLARMPTSIDNMNPSSNFTRALSDLPLNERVSAHSIIAVRGDGPPEEGSDGVVEFTSAHLEGVESELIVRSIHSSQGHPETILEVRRILLEHLSAP